MTTASAAGRAPLRRLVVLLGVVAMHALAAAPPTAAASTSAAGHAAPSGHALDAVDAVHLDHGVHGAHEPPGSPAPSHHGDGPTACDLKAGGAASGVAPLVTALAAHTSGATGDVLAPSSSSCSTHGLPPTTGPPGHATSCVLRT
ncbi:hypothetical protein [Quadrisphaera setariae]|uniref:Uncharacterized protein n=1 Tax=Quadrisphaera setariae TaxID=2593304 RepID=A0A5C8ZJT8_9ACTN|nr:hypothetical protein [Quadrisphaera setariae]TXR58152.1 hypothetical protein FMM08_02925 [Quadrisphaera setariae]